MGIKEKLLCNSVVPCEECSNEGNCFETELFEYLLQTDAAKENKIERILSERYRTNGKE